MRRLLVLALLAIATAVAITGVRSSGAEADGTYRVDAVFDTAKGILPQQLVKIAGARVGTVSDVTLTEDNKARIQMEVESKFAPFRTDARCQIQPEGLISENFVQCEPGTPDGRTLEGVDGAAPTVPVERTSVPVSLTDLFNIWKVPVRDRFAVVLAGLGAGVAGRGEDLNALLRRASPTLGLVRDVTEIASRQRDEIASLVTDTDRVVDSLARRSDDVAQFVDDAGKVTRRTARKQQQLRATVRGLPALLSATRPALQRLDELAASGRPLLAQLRDAGPQTARLVRDLGPFAVVGRDALRDFGETADQGRTATRAAKPVVRLLKRFSAEAIPAGKAIDQLFGSLRQRGFVENLLGVVYGLGATTARYDRTAHLVPARLSFGACGVYANVTVPECSARFSGPTGTGKSRSSRRRSDPGPEKRRDEPARSPESAPGRAPAPSAPKPVLPTLPQLDLPKTLDGLGNTLKDLLPPAQGGNDSNQAQKGLLDFLLR